MSSFETLHEIVTAARNRTPEGPWDYLMGGTETETTYRRNRQSLDAIALWPRVLRDVSAVDATTKVLGWPMRIPVFAAPIGSLHSLDASGAMGVAKACEKFGVMSMLSSVTVPGLEEIAAATKHPKVFQLYVRGDRAWVTDHIRRAIEAGYTGFCFTVDTALYSRRERDIISRWVPHARRGVSGFDYQASVTWDLIKWFKDTYSLPLALKGIGGAEDAELAVEHGVEMVYVSNHGGRQLDHGPGAMEVLPEVVKAVRGRATIFVDGGFYRGTDVIKALAMGAHAVGIGRICGLGLAADGEAGVLRVLELLEVEIRTSMGLMGAARIADLGPSFVRPTTPVRPGHAFESAFPHLQEIRHQRY